MKFLIAAFWIATAANCWPQGANNLLGAVTAVNYPPVADPQLIALENLQSQVQSLMIQLTGYDANGDALTFMVMAQPSLGTLSEFSPSNGQVMYTPPNHSFSSDSFTFAITDGVARSATAKVTIRGPSSVVSPSRTFISAIGNDANSSVNCGVTANCRTLSSALAHTAPGGEVVILDSGGYGPATISQSVVITASGIDASVSAAPSENAITINTSGNVTITGLNLHGQGTGLNGISVEQVGIFRLYGSLAENFTIDGINFAASGELAVYDSKFNDNQHDGILIQGIHANADIQSSVFDDNNNAGVEVVTGHAAVSDSSGEYNLYGFLAEGGTLVLSNDSAISNGTGLVSLGSGNLQFARCVISGNVTAFNVGTGSSMFGTNPGSTLIAPGQTSIGTLSPATTSQ